MHEQFIAHIRRKPDGSWDIPHYLLEHLQKTAAIAEKNAAKFHSATWGKVVGLAHDAGKGRIEWQEYLKLDSGYGYDDEANLEGKKGKIPHAIYGAMLAETLFGQFIGRVLAYCIAGHHAGLPDWSSAEGAGRASLQFQESQVKDLNNIEEFIREQVKAAKPEKPPWKFNKGLDFSLWIRMLFSSLVDADFLDTESYMDEEKARDRGGYCSLKELLDRFNAYMENLDANSENTKVNEIRRDIRRKCAEAAKEDQGIFSLSVPTGGGKTLSSLAFGLEHAIKHGLDRIIYVIPYTSIIEQNADVFRSVLGEDQVIEHHSSLEDDDLTIKSRLAAENWDAPIIVTTTVQFFESLFSAKPSRCRKLHNIARSVVILDEAQLIPIEFLGPILEAMQLLTEHYYVSFVISTATQPAFNAKAVNTFSGLKKVKEIIGSPEEVKKLYQSLRRYHTSFPANLAKQFTWEEIAQELKQYKQVLCIVSDRKSCRELYNLMPQGTFHLSALMCGQHRSEKIKEIKQKLKNKKPIRVISTQLVEAGVDFDFPVVYRALAGLDSIAQAAGRCNREGKLPELGKVIIFNPPKKSPMGILRKATDTTISLARLYNIDPMNYDLFEKYFEELYWKANSLDSKGIIKLLSPDLKDGGIFFRTASDRFKLIDDSLQKTILVRFGEGEKLIDLLKSAGPERWLMRKLQRYTVNIYHEEFLQLRKRGAIEEVWPNIYALVSNLDYSEDTGLLIEDTPYDPEKFMV
ncbi:MAG TPA: CRISPR-associated helicase Cas3' [Peptococcaceae bacterium]|nr:CRISPR-associated helicase Cas3' [Peptococcaceae bacterium]